MSHPADTSQSTVRLKNHWRLCWRFDDLCSSHARVMQLWARVWYSPCIIAASPQPGYFSRCSRFITNTNSYAAFYAFADLLQSAEDSLARVQFERTFGWANGCMESRRIGGTFRQSLLPPKSFAVRSCFQIECSRFESLSIKCSRYEPLSALRNLLQSYEAIV